MTHFEEMVYVVQLSILVDFESPAYLVTSASVLEMHLKELARVRLKVFMTQRHTLLFEP